MISADQIIKYEDSKNQIQSPIKNIKNIDLKTQKQNPSQKKSICSKTQIILISIICSLFVAGIIILMVFMLKPRGEEDNEIQTHFPVKNDTKILMFETEFEFNNRIRDPYSINVLQKYNEEILTNGNKTYQLVFKNTTYIIYFLNETYATEETKNFYNKTYTAAILISKQCIETKNEKCQPQDMIGLSKASRRNLRSLEDIGDLKDIPLPLCLFNITDNDVITSMKCPESLQKSIRQAMILDLYFFRPPAIKRPEKEANNVTIRKETKGEKQFIRETNGGICDVPDSFESFCSTEMNTTTDLNGNVLTYDEVAFTSIFHDENNSYTKNKITNLKDESEEILNIDKDAFEEGLEFLIEKLQPYFKYYDEFTVEEFKELYRISKNTSNSEEKNKKRNLNNEGESSASEEELFYYRYYLDIKFLISLLNDPGYNSDTIRAALNLNLNEDPRELAGGKENSNFKDIIKLLRTLSNSGNSLAIELYNKVQNHLENLDDIISENVTSLIKLILNEQVKSLKYIFDATLNMNGIKAYPLKLVQESSNIKNNLNNLYTIIKNGGMKSMLSNLNTNIYSYLSQSHKLLDNVFQNVRSLSNSLKSTKSKLTEISTYYLNNTPNSFNDVVAITQDLLLNYYKNEDDMIIKKVTYLIGNFSNNLYKSIYSELIIIDNLLENLEINYRDVTIEGGNEEDKNLLISNLRSSKEVIDSIVEKVEELIKKEMNLKENGHFLSEKEILSVNNSYGPDIVEAMETSKILDKDETIDKIFDKTFSDFKDNYTELMLEENDKIQQKAVFSENALENGLFYKENKTYLETNISSLGLKIADSINNDNDDYLNKANKEIDTFLEKNNETLKELIYNLTAIFSEDIIIQLAELYNTGINSCLKSLGENLENNKQITNNYFSTIAEFFKDNKKIIELLKTHEIDEAHIPYYLYYWSETHYVYFRYFNDTIRQKLKTVGYLNKYKIFSDKNELSKDYIENQMQSEFKYTYKNTITKLKELLQSIKSAKLSNRFPNYSKLKEIDDNLKGLDNLYKILNSYFYDEKYNSEYLPKIINFKKNSIDKLNIIKTNIIEINHNVINKYPTVNDYTNEFCFNYYRKKTYTCTNGVIYYPDSTSNYCSKLEGDKYDSNKLVSLSIYSDQNIQKFSSQLNRLYTKMSNIVTSYTTLINNLSKNLYSFEERANYISSAPVYLEEYKILINNILSNYYGKSIILATYEVFRDATEQRINNIFNETLIDWENLFSNLNTEVNNNLANYKNSITEFGLVAIIYYNYLNTNISEAYYDLLNSHAKTEFNYSITYYYNYLLKTINSEKQIILSKMPTNNIGFIRVIEQRKKEINEMFNEITITILASKNKDLNKKSQLSLLQVPEGNFFNISKTLTNFRKEIQNKIEDITYTIYGIDNAKKNDLYSYVSRLYLENSINGKQINDFYKEVDNQNFIYLDMDKFKQLIINNWIFDQNGFIKLLNDTLNDNNALILSELSNKKEKYKTTLEKELIKYKNFIKKDITFILDNLYSSAFKEISQNNIQQVENDIKSIVQKILYYLSEEEEWLKESNTLYYNNLSSINETIEKYKEDIILNLDNKIKAFVDEHKKELEEKVFTNYYEKYLKSYLTYIKEETELDAYKDFELLNSTYDIGEIINQLALDITDEYIYIVKKQIEHKYEKYYEKIFYNFNLDKHKEYIKNQIDVKKSKLFNALKLRATVDSKQMGYYNYDLRDDIKKGINDLIKNKYDSFSVILNTLRDKNYCNIDIKNIDNWEIPDFSKISNTIRGIKDLFISFMENKKQNEDNKIKECIRQTINFNFEDLLENLIPSFGNEFFERIIKYNENFKISHLYENLRWVLSQSISYLELLKAFSEINQITKDLKIKLYRMNDIDSEILKKNKIILDSLNAKANEFIFDSNLYIIGRYKYFIIEDANIELAFSNKIRNVIESVFEGGTTQIEQNYKNMMVKYLKNNLISSYKQVLDEKTEKILRIMNSNRDYLKIILDDIYSIDPDDVLNEINTKLNSTSEAIVEYNDHFYTFNISNELVEYLYNYGEKEVYPFFKDIKSLNDKIYKSAIISNLDTNCEDYEKAYDYEIFNSTVDSSFIEIKNNFIDDLEKSGHSYYDNYEEKLNLKINNLTLRRLDENYVSKIRDRDLAETFNKILNNSENLKIFIQSFEKFDEFDTKISESISELNSAYDESKILIINNNYTEEMTANFDDKLEYLKNHTLKYYSKINESFYNLKLYLNESIIKLYDLFNDCANITIETFEKKYKEIFDEVKPINYSKKEEIQIFSKESEIKTQNYQITVKTELENIQEDIEIKYDYQFEKNKNNYLNVPSVRTSIINLSRPKKLKIDFIKDITNCAKEIETIEVIFNNVNYSVSLDFSPKTTNIISNISGLFDDYEYSVERYNTSDTKEMVCVGNFWNTIIICTPGKCTNRRDQTLKEKESKKVKKKEINMIGIIPELN